MVLIHYEFEDVTLGYPFRPAVRTSTVFSESIPSQLWAVTQGIESVVMQEFVIRWHKEDVEKGILAEDPAGDSEDAETTSDSTIEEDERTTSTSTSAESSEENTSADTGSQQPSSNPESPVPQSSTNPKSTTLRNALIALGVVLFLLLAGAAWYFIRRYRSRRKLQNAPVPFQFQTQELGSQQKYEISGTQVPSELAGRVNESELP